MKAPDIGIKSNTRTAMIGLLNERLAEGIDLALAVKQAHWNLKGPNFIAVHEYLDTLRAALDAHVDTVAERVAQLDGIALGTTQATAKTTPLPAYPTDIGKVEEHLAALLDRVAAAARAVRTAIDTADDAGDAGTADIFTAYSRDLDKHLWFIRSHLA